MEIIEKTYLDELVLLRSILRCRQDEDLVEVATSRMKVFDKVGGLGEQLDVEQTQITAILAAIARSQNPIPIIWDIICDQTFNDEEDRSWLVSFFEAEGVSLRGLDNADQG